MVENAKEGFPTEGTLLFCVLLDIVCGVILLHFRDPLYGRQRYRDHQQDNFKDLTL